MCAYEGKKAKDVKERGARGRHADDFVNAGGSTQKTHNAAPSCSRRATGDEASGGTRYDSVAP